MIYPVDSVIQLLNNWSQMAIWGIFACSDRAFMRLNSVGCYELKFWLYVSNHWQHSFSQPSLYTCSKENATRPSIKRGKNLTATNTHSNLHDCVSAVTWSLLDKLLVQFHWQMDA